MSSRFRVFLCTITLRQTAKRVTRMVRRITRQRVETRESVLRRLNVTPLGVCLRVIVNKKPLNLEKTTSSVLSVSLINLWVLL